MQPLILWFRRDLRLTDHPMLEAALETGRPLVPLFILDPETEALGAAPLWRLGLGVEAFSARLAECGSRMILRRGRALDTLRDVIAETDAAGVMWQRLYDPPATARDTAVKAALRAAGLIADSYPGHLLFEPWEVETGQGGFFKVYTPFWKAVRTRAVRQTRQAPEALSAPKAWPDSESLADWHLGRRMGRGAAVVRPYQRVGEAAALARLDEFVNERLQTYREARDFPADWGATSGLSENLAWGEIGPATIWAAGMRAMNEGNPGAETFLKELVWREFSYHLMHHTPEILSQNWRAGWEAFPWRGSTPDAERWCRGVTGEPFVDAAMREMYVTGRMHNRARMITASYLCKHLMTDWRIGLDWFADCLTDWDPAANALGWQWVAGCGPDAAPYFRVFNPATQAGKFDPQARYRHRFIREGQDSPAPEAVSYFAACPKRWALDSEGRYPEPLVDLAEGRARALAAFAALKA